MHGQEKEEEAALGVGGGNAALKICPNSNN